MLIKVPPACRPEAAQNELIKVYVYAEMLAAKFGQVSASAYLVNTRQRIDRSIMVLGDGRVAEDTSAGLLPPKSAIEDVPRSSSGHRKHEGLRSSSKKRCSRSGARRRGHHADTPCIRLRGCGCMAPCSTASSTKARFSEVRHAYLRPTNSGRYLQTNQPSGVGWSADELQLRRDLRHQQLEGPIVLPSHSGRG